ncbi:hypothetical protein KKB99_04345 [bacterium]|nr:hypothetical protein [bacterium]MBU1025224.1 hypothetical protein [bacterium]
MTENPYNILLITIYTGYLLTALLTLYLIKQIGVRGAYAGILSNALIHLNLVFNGERIFLGSRPDTMDVLKSALFLVILNLIITIGTYHILKIKKYAADIPAVLGLFISSVFFWELYIPAIFALIILTLPSRHEWSD